ncbi:FAD-dependent oxidoreductase [Paenibacillus puerhi]|uniref:FAD-dependent oxidoreductase n=1 Tax=Paenibacillus puerhi TaxID=2692622 RepID=UPI00135B77AC|nr:FAD-dependent oxidoreductase [Paenibacillus puerhi]
MTVELNRDRSKANIPHWGHYDAVVIGGGISGVAAARVLAGQGRRVLLIEPTGVLGREIVRACNSFVRLDQYAKYSKAVQEFYECLQERQGWFNGQVDPAVAGVAFDDMMERHGVEVLFHIWPSRLLRENNRVIGLEVIYGSGRAMLDTNCVIDASAHGKIAAATFEPAPSGRALSMARFIYNGVQGECPDETALSLPVAGEVKVTCRPAYWKGEWRVTLEAARERNRAEWLVVMDEALNSLCERVPALQTGVLAHLADDVWGEPDMVISTGSDDKQVAGHVISLNEASAESEALPVAPIPEGLLCNRRIADGLFMAGPWVQHYPFDGHDEELAIVNAFLLGNLVGDLAAQPSSSKG